ncbi:MAG: hypothetical protein PHD48_01275 [Alphaproteobacteria bacterium]|nr:hypothetical protein [Alphaproteobacteria bacterium]
MTTRTTIFAHAVAFDYKIKDYGVVRTTVRVPISIVFLIVR